MFRELLAVAVRAALQWALSSLLLANGAAFCLIAAAASSLGLGPLCLLCAHVHRLLCSSSSPSAAASSQEHDAFRRLLCDAHVAAIADKANSETEQQLQQTCSASDRVDRGRKDGSDKLGGLEAHRVVSIGSEICEQDHDDDSEQPRATDRSNVARTSSMDNDNGDDPYVSLFELAPIAALPQDYRPDDHVQELDDTPETMSGAGERLSVDDLVAALRAQRKELEVLRAELDGERRARAEAAEYQRQLEEQGEFDREAVRLAMQLVHETESEKHGLQRQLDASRVKAQLYDAAAVDNRLGGQPSRDCYGHAKEEQEDSGAAGSREANGSDDNNYQSLVDFLPGSVYSSSPDLANLLKLYTEGNGARRPRGGLTDVSAVAVVAEEEEEDEEVAAVTVTAVSDSNGNDDTSCIAGACLQESRRNHVEPPEAASS